MEYVNLKNLNTQEINVISGGAMDISTAMNYAHTAFDKAKEYVGFDAATVTDQVKSYITPGAVTAAAATGAVATGAAAVTGAAYGIAHGITGGINLIKKYIGRREAQRLASLAKVLMQ